MSGALDWTLAGEPWQLLAGKALYSPSRRLLCVADVHFGKAAAYRALGQPVPGGTTADNLRRLDALLAARPVGELVFLGDFLHARAARTPAVLAALADWRARHPALRCTLVRGNHDLRAGDPPAELGFAVLEEPLRIGRYEFRHAPAESPSGHVIAGHEHPVHALRGRAHQQLRLPCFHLRPGLTVLPAFGAFTGGHAVQREADSGIVVTDGEALWRV